MRSCDFTEDVAVQALILNHLRDLGYVHIVRECLKSFSPRAADLSRDLEVSLPSLCDKKFLWWSFDGSTECHQMKYRMDEHGQKLYYKFYHMPRVVNPWRTKAMLALLNEKKIPLKGDSEPVKKMIKRQNEFLQRHGKGADKEDSYPKE